MGWLPCREQACKPILHAHNQLEFIPIHRICLQRLRIHASHCFSSTKSADLMFIMSLILALHPTCFASRPQALPSLKSLHRYSISTERGTLTGKQNSHSREQLGCSIVHLLADEPSSFLRRLCFFCNIQAATAEAEVIEFVEELVDSALCICLFCIDPEV